MTLILESRKPNGLWDYKNLMPWAVKNFLDPSFASNLTAWVKPKVKM